MSSLEHDSVQEGAVPLPTAHQPVINMPFTLVIDGRSFVGRSLSLVGAEASGLITPQMLNGRRLVTLQFAFSGYNVSFNIDAQIISVSTEAGSVGVRFLEPTGPHLPQLRYLMNAFIAGELVGIDSILGVSDESLPTVRPSHRPTAPLAVRTLGSGVRLVLLALATALLVLFVADRIYERFFVLPVSGVPVVSVEGTPLRAVAAGQMAFVNAAAKSGEPVFAIRTTSGEVLTVQMPCDCVVAPGGAKVGDVVFAGDTILDIAPTGAPLVVDAVVGPEALRALAANDPAQVRLPDGSFVLATLSPVANLVPQPGAALAHVRLVPKSPLDPALAGRPVSVSVLTNPWKAIAASSSFITTLLSNLGVAL